MKTNRRSILKSAASIFTLLGLSAVIKPFALAVASVYEEILKTLPKGAKTVVDSEKKKELGTVAFRHYVHIAKEYKGPAVAQLKNKKIDGVAAQSVAKCSDCLQFRGSGDWRKCSLVKMRYVYKEGMCSAFIPSPKFRKKFS